VLFPCSKIDQQSPEGERHLIQAPASRRRMVVATDHEAVAVPDGGSEIRKDRYKSDHCAI
jgi:hypothetical protein